MCSDVYKIQLIEDILLQLEVISSFFLQLLSVFLYNYNHRTAYI